MTLFLALPANAGTWGPGHFDNDHALDWSADCADSGTPADVRIALEAVLDAAHIDAPEGEKALVAAEVVAAALGTPNADLPEQLAGWVKRQPASELTDLAPLARRAVARVRDPKKSELHALWAEQGVAPWLSSVAELSARLEQAQHGF